MNFTSELFSPPHTFFIEKGEKNYCKAMLLYTSNVMMAEALYPVLHTVEITFRTSVNTHMIGVHDNDWLKNNIIRNGKVKSAIRKLNVIHGTSNFSNEMVVGELTFGDWVTIYKNQSETNENFDIRNVINYYLPVEEDDFLVLIEDIKNFRNDVFHHKPILNQNLKFKMDQCREILEILCSDRLIWHDSISRLDRVFERVKFQLERAKLATVLTGKN